MRMRIEMPRGMCVYNTIWRRGGCLYNAKLNAFTPQLRRFKDKSVNHHRVNMRDETTQDTHSRTMQSLPKY